MKLEAIIKQFDVNINPLKMEILNIIDSPEKSECGFELFDKDGKQLKEYLIIILWKCDWNERKQKISSNL